MISDVNQLKTFMEDWQEDQGRTKEGFVFFKDLLQGMMDISLQFIAREKITYSLRAKRDNQGDGTMFVLVDVICDRRRATLAFHLFLC